MSDENRQIALKVCPDCGVQNASEAKRCWMCRGDVTNAMPVRTAEELQVLDAARPFWESSRWFFLAPTLALAGLIALVGIGIAREQPSALIPYVILIAPAFLATVIHVGIKSATGKPAGWAEQLATFVLSTLVVMVIVMLIEVALVIAIFIYCLGVLDEARQRNAVAQFELVTPTLAIIASDDWQQGKPV